MAIEDPYLVIAQKGQKPPEFQESQPYMYKTGNQWKEGNIQYGTISPGKQHMRGKKPSKREILTKFNLFNLKYNKYNKDEIGDPNASAYYRNENIDSASYSNNSLEDLTRVMKPLPKHSSLPEFAEPYQ